jgi:hypothetical protein
MFREGSYGGGSHSCENTYGSTKHTYINESYPYEPKASYLAAVTLQNLFGGMQDEDLSHLADIDQNNVILKAMSRRGDNPHKVVYAAWRASPPVASQGVSAPRYDGYINAEDGCYTLYDERGFITKDNLCANHVQNAPTPQRRRFVVIGLQENPQYLVLKRPTPAPTAATPAPTPTPTPAPEPTATAVAVV